MRNTTQQQQPTADRLLTGDNPTASLYRRGQGAGGKGWTHGTESQSCYRLPPFSVTVEVIQSRAWAVSTR